MLPDTEDGVRLGHSPGPIPGLDLGSEQRRLLVNIAGAARDEPFESHGGLISNQDHGTLLLLAALSVSSAGGDGVERYPVRSGTILDRKGPSGPGGVTTWENISRMTG